MSERSLRYAFADLNTTFSTLVAEARVAKAKALLRDESQREQRIIEIALRCGYQSASHFARQFRERVGMAPTAYREHYALRPVAKIQESPLAL